MKSYKVDELVDIFAKQAINAEHQQRDQIRRYQENYPDVPLPLHFYDDFNLSKALSIMCMEIQKLKSCK